MLVEEKEKPWLKYYGKVPHSISYPDKTLYEKLQEIALKNPEKIAWEFMNNEFTYKQFLNEIDQFADGLLEMGFKQGDVITISMPTSPHGIVPIYAVNKIGGVCSMIHPLSPIPQIEMYLKISKSNWVLTLDAFYPKIKETIHNVFGNKPSENGFTKLILTRIPDYLSGFMKIGFYLTKSKLIKTKKKKLRDINVVWYDDILRSQKLKKLRHSNSEEKDKNFGEFNYPKMKPKDLAIILYSGGTTGAPKGIMLSNKNLIAEGLQVSSWANIGSDDSVLAILPIFHGFGLGVCVNAAFMAAGKSILIPIFTPETVAKLVKKKRPNYLIGVPTLFEALANNKEFQNTDLSCLKATFSGADTLPSKTKEKFEQVVRDANGDVKLLEGYGLTEAVTAMMATPLNEYRKGSIGIPFPDMDAKIVKLETIETATIGEEGELCVNGPDVMLGYLDNPEENARVLKTHDDGKLWLHTGDICTMDEDGFFYFKLRQKRMLKVSGINVYPKNVEETLRKHPEIKNACVIGLPDDKQISRIKAFIVLKKPELFGKYREKLDHLTSDIKKFCHDRLLKWECPREIEFREDLPITLVGKVAWKVLLDEELEKIKIRPD